MPSRNQGIAAWVAAFLLLLLVGVPPALAGRGAYEAELPANLTEARDLCALVPCTDVFPGAARFSERMGQPPYVEAYGPAQGGKAPLLGYVMLSTDITDIPAYSGKPVVTLIGMDRQGRYVGVKVLKHSEPILLLGIPESALLNFNKQFIDISGDKMVLLQDHPIRSEPHDFIIFKRELLHPKPIYSLDDFPLATKDPKQSGVVRNGKKVTVRLTSQAPSYSLREFKLKKGDEVTLILTNLDKVEDLTHGFAIPKYDINFIVNPQETASVTFIADKPGVFWCYCTHFCHALHLEMRSRMIVEA